MIEVFQRISYDPNIVFENELEIKQTDYEKRAEVDSDSLEDAWSLTQNNDRDWINNKHVKYLGKAKDCRSTSIGDVFAINGRLEIIMPLGYVSFNWGDKISFYSSIQKVANQKQIIKVKHPDESCNQMQEAFLAKCPADERRFHELLFTHGNITYRYHQEAKTFKPTEADYKEWLEGLPENMRRDMEGKGFEACKGILSFTRYVNEKNDIGLDEYVRQQMDPEDYAEYQSFLTNR